MKKYNKLLYFGIIVAIIACIYGINITYAKYQIQLEGKNVTINSLPYSRVTATVTVVANQKNTYDVTITNNNSYDINCKIKDENNMYGSSYANQTEDYATVSANETSTIRVTFNEKDDVIYENIQEDSNGELYQSIEIYLETIKPYKDEQFKIASGQKVILEESIKNRLIRRAGTITHYTENQVFTGVSSTSEAGLCSIIDPVSKETIYFYRGNVTNNYVSFAGQTWRILRINADGSMRLILNGVATSAQYQTSNTPEEKTLESALKLLSWKDSKVYEALHTWYNSTITESYSSYVVPTDFAFDTSNTSDIASSETGDCTYFGPYIRAGKDSSAYQPTFSTAGSLVRDNVGLITSDEILYAGGFWGTNNTSYFLCNSSITVDTWTMSPSFWDRYGDTGRVGMIVLNGSNGKVHDWPSGNTVKDSLGIRPVISIRGDLEMTGEGTASSPYRYK